MALEIKIPTVGESITEVTVSNWLVKDGDYVKQDQVICELESDKATFELNAEKAGVIKILVKAGDNVAVGDVVCSIDTEAKAPEGAAAEKPAKQEAPKAAEPKAEPAVAAKSETAASTYATGFPSPAAAKIIDEKGLDKDNIQGTGRDGRITKADAENAAKNGAAKPAVAETTSSEASPQGNFSRETRAEKMSNLRKTIAKRLVAAKNQTAMLTTFNEVDMTEIMRIRNVYKDKFKEKYGVNLGFMSFFTKACCIALREFPAVNGIIENEQIIFHDFCDIGIAVSTPKGLVVPVIRNAESLDMAGIEKAVMELATKGRDNKLTIEEMAGGTFTISNGGVFGSLMSTPILNIPQSAILGMHKIQDRPMAINGKVEIRPMMYLALSYDHRIIDGKESVSFLVRVKEMLENPGFMLTAGDPAKKLLGL
ncbi:MAG: 2-oxoglutarate dehydrogenase complex dihydrolipoyllysine-residue succinyltransferase [Chitinophagales bacterium]|nr:2-oxoglutarate dehydrogenase complex dihydrolipoyllysine-residue succinyltransferase [Chitinophagales bacterium]